ncbi:MAG: hypothetical protein JW723_11600 [Bacteroidales bacterium]|nr:hypothetical protein [Bacteroidales bacterium]
MKKNLLIILAITLLAAGCEMRKFEFAPTINVDETYTIDQTGAFFEIQTITRAQVMDALDIPETATVKEFNIEKISLRVTVLEGNQASVILASGKLELGSNKPDIFENFPVSLIKVDAPWIGLNDLIAEGVESLKGKIEGYVLGNDDSPFNIVVSGDSSPTAGQKINVSLELKITGSVKYVDCIETLPYFGDDCDI